MLTINFVISFDFTKCSFNIPIVKFTSFPILLYLLIKVSISNNISGKINNVRWLFSIKVSYSRILILIKKQLPSWEITLYSLEFSAK